jgi:hypothetical protein
VALDGEAAFGVSTDGMIVYLLLFVVVDSVIANFINQIYQNRVTDELLPHETFVKPPIHFGNITDAASTPLFTLLLLGRNIQKVTGPNFLIRFRRRTSPILRPRS